MSKPDPIFNTVKGKKPVGPPRRKTVTPSQTWKIFKALARAQTAFASCRAILTPEVARSISDVYYAYYSVLCDFYDANGGLPSFQFLKDGVDEFVAAHPELLTEHEQEELIELVDQAWSEGPEHEAQAEDPACIKFLIGQVKLLYQDHVARKIRDTLVDDAMGLVPLDMTAVLSEYQSKIQQSQSMGGHAVVELFPPGWENQEPPVLRPLGVDLFDQYMGGGLGDGEVMLFIAPTGSCKSVVTCMMAALFSKQCQQIHAAMNFVGPAPTVLLVSYEEPVEELRVRILAILARIPRDRACLPLHKLYDTFMPDEQKHNLDWYERKEFADQILNPNLAGAKSERQRVKEAAEQIKHYIRIIPFTGKERLERGGDFGCGGVQEIVSNIAMFRRELAIIPYFILIDHLAAMVANMQENTPKVDAFWLRNTLKNTPRLLQQHLAQPLGCPVFLTHQVAGAACRMQPTTAIDHTFGEDCKSVAQYCNFAFWAGNVGVKDSMTLFGCSKHRRNKPMENSRVFVDGAYNRIKDVSKQYVVVGNAFVKQVNAGVVGKAPMPSASHAQH